jgi:hypothetical protein
MFNVAAPLIECAKNDKFYGKVAVKYGDICMRHTEV